MKKKETQISPEFKRQATKAIFAITIFIISYLIILLLSLTITILCIVGGFSLIVFKPSFITIVLGVGLASFGVLIVIFLLKFIFKSHKSNRSHLIEINATQEPELFNMIHEIVIAVGTKFPKKVYLSSDVNAAVFYDSNFWSMFLPVKKNLEIGLGLVNTVTKEELKAILAHEFGHFSQKSMKVGSYVYNVNQIIHNILYDNESYQNLMQSWANISEYFSIFVAIAVKTNQGIQWILRKLYEVVNKSYMALSREMEFHADAIAASVTGYEPLKKSLLRLSIAENAYNRAVNFYFEKIPEKIKTENIFKNQSNVLQYLSNINNLPVSNGLPDISLEEQSKYDKSKLIIKNQWASHPSTEDRVKRLEETGFISENTEDVLAKEIFVDLDRLEKLLTDKIFENITYEGDVKNISTEEFNQEFISKSDLNSFPTLYNGYYDNKNPVDFVLSDSASIKESFVLAELFSDEKVDWVYTAIALKGDIDILTRIANKSIPIKTFDYDGVRYKRKDAQHLSEKLKSELVITEDWIRKNDQDIYTYFIQIERQNNKPERLETLYSEFFSFDKLFDVKHEIYTKLSNMLQFVSVTTPYDQIKSNLDKIKPFEQDLKKEINLLLNDEILTVDITKDLKENLESYTSKEWTYFSHENYLENNLNVLFTAMNNFSFLLSRKYFRMKMALLQYQEELTKQ